MKRIITILSILGSVTALILVLGLHSARLPRRMASGAAQLLGRPPLNQPQRVDFEITEEALVQLSPREVQDQLKDWLLFAAVGAEGLSPEQFNEALFDRHAVRYGYLRPLGSFEYGDSRSAVIGDGKVLALLPAGSHGKHLEELARIADEQRKNLGRMPDTVLVYEYQLDPDGRSALLTRRQQVDGRSLFTTEYGYSQVSITSRSDLERFMRQVDAISAVRNEGGHLILEGRKIQDNAYRGIQIEDVAAVWQAEQGIQARSQIFRAKWDSMFASLNERWSSQSYTTPAEEDSLRLRHEEEQAELEGRMYREQRAEGVVDGSGFSLDPTYDYPALLRDFRRWNILLHKLASDTTAAITPKDIQNAERGLVERDPSAFLDLAGKLKNSPALLDELMGTELLKKSREFAFQAARYDGDLRGTEVGMVLFYTDLLAKLWALDYMGRGPEPFIEGFRVMPHMTLSPIYRRQVDSLNNTRLWFGPQDNGFQVAEQGNALLFAPQATRVYAASANEYHPGRESPANAWSGAFLGWWNDHYEEVARYEPEYQRLNEIMKWSLVISWLHQAGTGDALGFLGAVAVDRSQWFPDWVRNHPELRFRAWDNVAFYPRGYKSSRTEALPLLSSVWFSPFGDGQVHLEGGVSLAPKRLFSKRAPLSTDIAAISRRSNLDYSAGFAGTGRLRTLDGLTFDIRQASARRWSVEFTPANEAKLESRTGELRPQKFERVVTARDRGVEIETKGNSAEVGTLDLSRTENGFNIGWRSRDIDRGQLLARRLSLARDPEALLINEPTVETMIVLPERSHYLVKLSGSEKWIKLAPEQTSNVEIAAGWSARVAEPGAARNMQIAWLDNSEIGTQLGTDGLLVVQPLDGAGRSLLTHIRDGSLPAGSKPVNIQADGLNISAHLDPGSQGIYLRFGDLPPKIGGDLSELGRLLRPHDLAEIRRTAETGTTAIAYRLPDGRTADGHALVQSLRRRDYATAARTLVDDPRGFRTGLNRDLADRLSQVDELLDEGRYWQAKQVLIDVGEAHGALPDVTLRRALADLGEGRVRDAEAALQRTAPMPLKNREALFDEINRRLEIEGLDDRERRSLRTLAEFADWSDLEARRAAPHGQVLAGSEDGAPILEYRLAAMPRGDPVPAADFSALARGDAPVYIQDSPGLNNLDWPAGLEPSLHQMVSGELGRVVRLPQGDIAHFRPALIYGPDKATKFRLTGEAGVTGGPLYAATAVAQAVECAVVVAVGHPKACPPVYLVMASSDSQ